MRTERLIAMANEIAAFFSGAEPDAEVAAEQMAIHLRRYWDPRMRARIVQHVKEGGEGLAELACRAVGRM